MIAGRSGSAGACSAARRCSRSRFSARRHSRHFARPLLERRDRERAAARAGARLRRRGRLDDRGGTSSLVGAVAVAGGEPLLDELVELALERLVDELLSSSARRSRPDRSRPSSTDAARRQVRSRPDPSPGRRFRRVGASDAAWLSQTASRLDGKCARQESNLRPFAPEANALSPELRAPGPLP